MMRPLFVITALFISVPVFSQENPCKQLADAISVTFPGGFPGLVNAGSVVQFSVMIKVANPTLLEPFKAVPVSILISNGMIGSKIFQEFFNIKEGGTGEPKFQENFIFKLHLNENQFGHYSPKASLIFFDGVHMCAENIKRVPRAIMVVKNDPLKADVHAPIIDSLEFDQEEYKLGKEGTLTFTAIDKSPICTEELIQKGKCKTVWHIAFTDIGSGRSVDLYPKTYQGPNGTFRITFVIAETDQGGQPLFTSGTYRINGINVGDIWGNTIHDLPLEVQKTFRVK